jgi:hypothetical protein
MRQMAILFAASCASVVVKTKIQRSWFVIRMMELGVKLLHFRPNEDFEASFGSAANASLSGT